jgi:putative aldouronate transport system substrate-binding protein
MKRLVLFALAVFLSAPTVAVFAAGEQEASAQPELGEAAGPERLDVTEVEDYRSEFDIDEFPKNEKFVPYWLYDKKDVTLEWFIDFSWYASTPWNAEETLLHQLVKEETGIELEFIIPASGDEKLNAMIAANDLPDVITDDQTAQQLQLLITSDRAWALNELIDKYNPEFWNWVPESMISWFTHRDGNWYIFPNNYEAPEHVEAYEGRIHPKINTGIWVRDDLMKQVGIERSDFRTQDGFVEALKKVKDAGLTYNGLEVIPCIIGEDGGRHTFDYVLPDMFAIPREDEDGNYVDWRYHPKTLDMLQFVARLVREGLILPENLTATDKQLDDWSDSGRAFLGLRGTADTPGTLVDNNSDASFTYAEMVRADDGRDPIIVKSGTGWTGTIITKQASDPARIIRFFEYVHANQLFWSKGQQENLFTWNESTGRIEYTDKYLDVRSEGWKPAALEFGTNRFYWLQDRYPIQSVEPVPTLRSEIMTRNTRGHSVQYALFTNAFSQIEPAGGTRERATYERINDYWEEQIVKMMITKSDAEVEQMWNSTLERMDELGNQDIIEVINENFQANKNKLGLERAWPEEVRSE